MKHIWIIDDDKEMAAAISLMLKMIGHPARHFFSARLAAKELLDGGRPDLILLDISMPEVTGIMMLEFIRRRPEWNTIPIIMLSSEATETQVEEARQLGADDYVMKPVTLEELEDAIQTVWQKYHKE